MEILFAAFSQIMDDKRETHDLLSIAGGWYGVNSLKGDSIFCNEMVQVANYWSTSIGNGHTHLEQQKKHDTRSHIPIISKIICKEKNLMFSFLKILAQEKLHSDGNKLGKLKKFKLRNLSKGRWQGWRFITQIGKQQPLHPLQMWVKSQGGPTRGTCLSSLKNLTLTMSLWKDHLEHPTREGQGTCT